MEEQVLYKAQLEDMRLSKIKVEEIADKRKYNETISTYFYLKYLKTGKLTFMNLADNVYSCNKNWMFDFHKKNGVYDLTKAFLCHNRFCVNCQKVQQSSRLARFESVLEEYAQSHDLYHVVFTMPNVLGASLKSYIEIMFEAFTYINRYLNGNAKIKGLDFSNLGYTACLRALEVTFGKYSEDDFHPHLHCIFAFKKGLNFNKQVVNSYSYDYESGVPIFKRKFSNFEILIQKIWFLLINRISQSVYKYKEFDLPEPLECSALEYKLFPSKTKKQKLEVNLSNILSIDKGYSVICDLIDGNSYFEVFKYAFKMTSEKDQSMTNFQCDTLYSALKGKRAIQGYGDWYNLKIDDSVKEVIDEYYFLVKTYLNYVDPPTQVSIPIENVVSEMEKFPNAYFISKSTIYKQLKSSSSEETIEVPVPLKRFKETHLPEDDVFEDAKKKPIFNRDFRESFDFYCNLRSTHPDFIAEIKKQVNEKSENKPIVFTSEQISMFYNIFN